MSKYVLIEQKRIERRYPEIGGETPVAPVIYYRNIVQDEAGHLNWFDSDTLLRPAAVVREAKRHTCCTPLPDDEE